MLEGGKEGWRSGVARRVPTVSIRHPTTVFVAATSDVWQNVIRSQRNRSRARALPSPISVFTFPETLDTVFEPSPSSANHRRRHESISQVQRSSAVFRTR